MADDEMWDVTDVQGTPTGPVPAGSFHIVASVCVVASTGRVLVSRRAEGKDYPLAWEFPAGSALRGESSRRGAIRELDEEVGISVLSDDLVLVGRVVEERALFDLWITRVEGEPDVVVDPEEVREAEWVDVAEVRRRWEAGLFATPWNARFEQLWDEWERAVRGEE